MNWNLVSTLIMCIKIVGFLVLFGTILVHTSLVLLWYFFGIYLVLLWYFFGAPLVLLWYLSGTTLVPFDDSWLPFGTLRYLLVFHGSFWYFMVPFGISMYLLVLDGTFW